MEPSARRMWDILLVPLTCFVVVGAMSPLYSDEEFAVGNVLWQLVILWPIGVALLYGPAAVLQRAKLHSTVVVGQIAIGVVGVAGLVVVIRDDSSTAGLGYLWVPVVGCAVVGVLRVAERVRVARHALGG